MREPHVSETRTDGLTTEQLANATGTQRTQTETRTFAETGSPSRRDAAPQRLFAEAESSELQTAWDNIQAGFVDEPRRAVEAADHLVANTMKRLAAAFADERQRLESQWGRGDDVSTEDLRIALQRYRAFFARLLSV